MENSKELKPCPCCGGKAEQGTTSLADTYSDYEQIECTVCGLAIPLVIDGDMKGGIKRWNTRHDDAAIRKECADMAVEKFWYELHEEADNQYDRRVELLGPVETAEDASYRKTLYDGWSAWLLAKRIVINRHAAIEGGEN